MKRCPECGREYDATMMFCLDDGAELLYGPASAEGPATAILSGHGAAAGGQFGNEAATREQIDTDGQTAILPSGTGDIMRARGFDRRILLAPVLLAMIVAGGYFGYRYLRPAASEQIRSIAVLPFENRSGSTDTDYLSEGLADSLIYRLSELPDIKVSPTSSVMKYRGKETDVARVATELKVDAVMSGRLIQRGDDLSISVQLIDSRTEKVIWAEQYDRKMADLLATQREIATAITEKLQTKLAGPETKRLTRKYTDNNEAYQSYLKGRYYWNRRTQENLDKAIGQFKAATESDPNFALAYSGLADCYTVLTRSTGTPTSESIPQAMAYAERAIALDDQLAEPHASLGAVKRQSWQWTEAERAFKRAIELNPNYASAYHFYSILLKDLGRFDEAASMIRRARDLDPLSSVIGLNVSLSYQLQNDHNASIENIRKIIDLDPNFSPAYTCLGHSYLKQGRNAEAITALEKAVELSNRGSVALTDLGFGYGVVGKRVEANAIANELEGRYARKEANGRFAAAVYAGLGEKDKAFKWLEKDFDSKGDVAIIRWDIVFESLRDDPRYKDLLKRMGLPE